MLLLNLQVSKIIVGELELTMVIVLGMMMMMLIPGRALQIFSGTLTEIICLADSAPPVFHLVEQERVYNSRDYDQLPDLFGIEARFSPNRDNITLYISGTNRSNNVTVMCINEDVFSGHFQTLFTLMLEFVSKFINQA